jgi:hypothetical protein
VNPIQQSTYLPAALLRSGGVHEQSHESSDGGGHGEDPDDGAGGGRGHGRRHLPREAQGEQRGERPDGEPRPLPRGRARRRALVRSKAAEEEQQEEVRTQDEDRVLPPPGAVDGEPGVDREHAEPGGRGHRHPRERRGVSVVIRHGDGYGRGVAEHEQLA